MTTIPMKYITMVTFRDFIPFLGHVIVALFFKNKLYHDNYTNRIQNIGNFQGFSTLLSTCKVIQYENYNVNELLYCCSC